MGARWHYFWHRSRRSEPVHSARVRRLRHLYRHAILVRNVLSNMLHISVFTRRWIASTYKPKIRGSDDFYGVIRLVRRPTLRSGPGKRRGYVWSLKHCGVIAVNDMRASLRAVDAQAIYKEICHWMFVSELVYARRIFHVRTRSKGVRGSNRKQRVRARGVYLEQLCTLFSHHRRALSSQFAKALEYLRGIAGEVVLEEGSGDTLPKHNTTSHMHLLLCCSYIRLLFIVSDSRFSPGLQSLYDVGTLAHGQGAWAIIDSGVILVASTSPALVSTNILEASLNVLLSLSKHLRACYHQTQIEYDLLKQLRERFNEMDIGEWAL